MSTLDVDAGKVEKLDGVEALLEISGSLFHDISGGQGHGPSKRVPTHERVLTHKRILTHKREPTHKRAPTDKRVLTHKYVPTPHQRVLYSYT